MMRRTATFIKDIQCVCLYWGIDASDGKVNKTIMDFCCEMEKFYNEHKQKQLETMRSYPDADPSVENGEIIDSIIDVENKKYIFLFANHKKLSMDLDRLMGSNVSDIGEVDEEYISSSLNKIISILKKDDNDV